MRRHIGRVLPELLHFAQLNDRDDSRVDPLSGGMKRQLAIARSLIMRVVVMPVFLFSGTCFPLD